MELFALMVSDVEADVPGPGAPATGATRRVWAGGELDMSSAEELDTCLNGLVDDGVVWLTFDAGDVTFLDSSGLRVLVDASVRLERAGGSLVIDPMSNCVRRLLDMTGLLDRYAAG